MHPIDLMKKSTIMRRTGQMMNMTTDQSRAIQIVYIVGTHRHIIKNNRKYSINNKIINRICTIII
jgi:hypothetical protein